MTNVILQAKQRIRDYVTAGEWGVKYRLAKRAGVAPSSLNKMFEDDWAPGSEHLEKLLDAIDELEAEADDESQRVALA